MLRLSILENKTAIVIKSVIIFFMSIIYNAQSKKLRMDYKLLHLF